MIADETVERVRQAADIVEVIGEFVPLKRSGGTWRGPCPFHQGKNPNFSISPSHGSYHCFVCHESGDVFTFIRKRLGLDWPSAVKYIGEKVGIEVVDTPRRAQAPDPNAPNYEALAAAAEWFQGQLRDEQTGRPAREYLESRALDPHAWHRFGLGFAPRDPQALRRHLHALGVDDARQLECGILVHRDGEGEPRIRFRGRVMFPIQDELGRYVGFGGRAMGDEQPKYLNSPESSVFQKRRTLYGLHTAKQAMRRVERAIVVEGYLDAIRLSLAGLEEVVAPLGTALTEEQAHLLTRYTANVFLLYDSDEAGQKATFRSGLELLRARASVQVVSLPDGEDPDSFVHEHGRAGMEAQLGQAIDLFDRQVQLLERRGWFTDLRHRRTAIDKLLPTIRAAKEPLTRDMYLARLADVTHVDKATLSAEADALPEAGARRHPGRAVGGAGWGEGADESLRQGPPGDDAWAGFGREDEPAPLPPPPAEQRPAWTPRRRGYKPGPEWQATNVPPRPRRDEPVERALVRAMLVERGVAERVAERHPPDTFRDPAYRELFDVLLHAPLDNDLEQVAERLTPETLRVLRELTEAGAFDVVAADIGLSLCKLDVRVLERRVDELRVAMRGATREEHDTLMRERLEVEAEIRRLMPMRSPRGRPKAGGT
ncbi:DNA primase [Gemmatimonas sp.]|uniref:DNA primase n=2 Tax=Gemmatimonas sp. TaxID=1962908 RepID=UPI0025B7B3A0|nr:DNA primase [Gemmatimonas sp.]MCA2984354.1 DNA primase [Gemmatimonas sp.]MCA2994057.1 DNA primase [Gemmatimonas sp.]